MNIDVGKIIWVSMIWMIWEVADNKLMFNITASTHKQMVIQGRHKGKVSSPAGPYLL